MLRWYLIRRTAALPYRAKRHSFHPPTEEIRHGHSRFHGPPIRIRTIGPGAPGTAPRQQFPGAYSRPHAADRARRLDFHAEGRTSTGQSVELVGVQRAPTNQDDARHPLRDLVV